MAESHVTINYTITIDRDFVRVDGIPIWNLDGATGRDLETGVELHGLNIRVFRAAKTGFGKEPDADGWLAEQRSQLAMEVDSLGG